MQTTVPSGGRGGEPEGNPFEHCGHLQGGGKQGGTRWGVVLGKASDREGGIGGGGGPKRTARDLAHLTSEGKFASQKWLQTKGVPSQGRWGGPRSPRVTVLALEKGNRRKSKGHPNGKRGESPRVQAGKFHSWKSTKGLAGKEGDDDDTN